MTNDEAIQPTTDLRPWSLVLRPALFLGCNQDVVVLDFHPVSWNRSISRQGADGPGLHIEASAVARTDNHIAMQFPFHQGAPIVGTYIVNGIEFAVNIK